MVEVGVLEFGTAERVLSLSSKMPYGFSFVPIGELGLLFFTWWHRRRREMELCVMNDGHGCVCSV